MWCREILVSYNLKDIANYLKEKGENSFTVFDLVDKFGGDQSMAEEPLQRLITFGALKSDHNVKYIDNLPYRCFHFPNADNLEGLIANLPERVEVTFKRWVFA